MIGHAIMQAVDIFVAGAVRALAVVIALRGFVHGAGQFAQPLSVLFFQRASLFEKAGKVLSREGRGIC